MIWIFKISSYDKNLWFNDNFEHCVCGLQQWLIHTEPQQVIADPWRRISAINLIEPSLRTQVLISQTQAGMWRRNGYSLLNQVAYFSYKFCKSLSNFVLSNILSTFFLQFCRKFKVYISVSDTFRQIFIRTPILKFIMKLLCLLQRCTKSNSRQTILRYDCNVIIHTYHRRLECICFVYIYFYHSGSYCTEM